MKKCRISKIQHYVGIFYNLKNPRPKNVSNQLFLTPNRKQQIRMASKYTSTLFRKMSFSADMFKAPASLRARGEPEVSRLCPGVVSVLLGIFFIYVLMDNFFKMLNYQQIKTATLYETEQDLSLPSYSNLKLSISPAWLDHVKWSRMFAVDVVLVIETKTESMRVSLELERCRAEQWDDYGETFTAYVMKENICVKNPEDIRLKGTSVYMDIQYLEISISRCNSTLDPQCMSQSEFSKQAADMYKNRYNYFSLYILDTSINIKKKDPIQTRITLDYNFLYTNMTRVDFEVFLGKYFIETDRSVWPVMEEIEAVRGYYVSETTQTVVDKRVENRWRGTTGAVDGMGELYGKVFVFMSTSRKIYKRTVGKIDGVFSYAGGLFGLIVSVISVFVYSYNKFSYQLLVAQHTFNYDESGEKVRFSNFNFLRYIKFQIYDWLSQLSLAPDWSDCRMIAQTKDQANLYMDVEYLFRRLWLTQVSIRKVLSQNEEKILFLTEPLARKEVEERRSYLEYYNSIIQSKQAINIEDLKSGQVKIHLVIERIIDKMGREDQKNDGVPNDLIMNTIKQNQNYPLKQSLRRNLLIHDQKILDYICKFKHLYQQSKQIQLEGERLQEAQQKFANAYRNADEQTRKLMIDKIPLKILFRLNEKIQAMRLEDQRIREIIRREEMELRGKV